MSTLSESDRAKIRAAAHIIESNLRYHYTIKELSERVLMGATKLKEAFKTEYGIGTYEYLVAKRLEKASEMLLRNDLLHTVAITVGFSGRRADTNFIRFFKKEMKETPHVWKQKRLAETYIRDSRDTG
jgi:AraC-like DNA-binding protein